MTREVASTLKTVKAELRTIRSDVAAAKRERPSSAGSRRARQIARIETRIGRLCETIKAIEAALPDQPA